MSTYTNGDLRVFHIQNPPRPAIWYDVKTPADGLGTIHRLADKDMLLGVEVNVIGLAVYEDGDWVDWYDGEGDDIDAWAEKAEAKPGPSVTYSPTPSGNRRATTPL